MPVIRADAIICSIRNHGEHGAVVRLLTEQYGLQAGYVRGARSRINRPILMPANAVTAELRSRSEDQLASLTVELVHSRAPYFAEPLTAAAFSWVTLLTGGVLPEGHAYPPLYKGLTALLEMISVAPSARWWARALVEYERLLLAELGFGLDLERCAVTGESKDLHFVSPKTGRAVSVGASGVYADRLFPLPQFLIKPVKPDWQQIMQGIALTGYFIERAFFSDGRRDGLAARELLLDRLKRVVA